MLPLVLGAISAVNAVAGAVSQVATAAQRKTAQDFEAQAMSQLLAPAFNAVDPSKGPFGGGAAEAQWRPMMLDAMTGAAARSGQGIGIGDMVLREMLRIQQQQQQGGAAAATAATGNGGAAG